MNPDQILTGVWWVAAVFIGYWVLGGVFAALALLRWLLLDRLGLTGYLYTSSNNWGALLRVLVAYWPLALWSLLRASYEHHRQRRRLLRMERQMRSKS